MINLNFIEYFPDKISYITTCKNEAIIIRKNCDVELYDIKNKNTIQKFGIKSTNRILKAFFGQQRNIILITDSY